MAACPWARLWGFTRLSLKSKNEQILCTSISTDRHWGKHMENSSRKSHWRKIKCISYSQQVSDWKLIQAPKRHPDAEAKHGRLWYCTAASWLQFQRPPSGKGWAITKSSRGQVSFTISFFPKQPTHYCSSNPNSTTPDKHCLSNSIFRQSINFGWWCLGWNFRTIQLCPRLLQLCCEHNETN